MSKRADKKQESQGRILEAAGRRLRAEGIDGAGIAAVMADAGLTHGAFYAHFQDKDELARAALVHALAENRRRWMGRPEPESWPRRLSRLASRYLTPAHRRDLADGCALAALAADAGRTGEAFKETYEGELLKSLSAIAEEDFRDLDEARAEEVLAFMALMVGSISLARAVRSKDLSDRLLKAGRAAAAKLARTEA